MSATFSRTKIVLGRAEKAYYAGSVGLVLFSILSYTYPSIHMVHQVYFKQKIKAEIRELTAEQNRLKVEHEVLLSHVEMERLARYSGFIEPEDKQLIYVQKAR